MDHPIHRVTSVTHLGGYRVHLTFEDGTSREVDLEPVLQGDIYRPLRDPALFAQVQLDPEVHTLVWPNGADFDPAMLHDWPERSSAMCALTATWDAPGAAAGGLR